MRSNHQQAWVLLTTVCWLASWALLVVAVSSSLSRWNHAPGSNAPNAPPARKGNANARLLDPLPFDARNETQRLPPSTISNTSQEPASPGDRARGNAVPLDREARRQAAESALTPLKEYATGVTFPPMLDEGLYLVGCGVRKKSIVKVYAVAMYSSAAVLNEAAAATLGRTARSFDAATPATSFILEMVYGVGAEKMADAIAESVRPRHGGSASDLGALAALITEGVHEIGGHAVKGTVFRFDCSREGVRVGVNGKRQGIVASADLGGAFVDVYMDDNAVSPTLVDSCVTTWSGEEAQLLAATLLEASPTIGGKQTGELQTTHETAFDEDVQKQEASGSMAREDESRTNLLDNREAEQQPAEVEFAAAGALCREHRGMHQMAKMRARYSVLQQQQFIVDAVRSMRTNGSIQEQASDRAAQKLRFLASHVENEDSLALLGSGVGS